MEHLPNIIDIEASGFGKKSYPIEVGYALANGDMFCSLIVPESDWDRWDESAEAVHGITQQVLLNAGSTVIEIAQTLNRNLSGETLYSDAWANDLSWLGLLFDAADLPMQFRLNSIRSLLTEEQAAHWHETKESVIKSTNLKRHRASSDAVILQKTYSVIQKENKK